MDAIRLLPELWRARRGVTAVEYALMGGLLAVAVASAMGLLTQGFNTAFHLAASKIPT